MSLELLGCNSQSVWGIECQMLYIYICIYIYIHIKLGDVLSSTLPKEYTRASPSKQLQVAQGFLSIYIYIKSIHFGVGYIHIYIYIIYIYMYVSKPLYQYVGMFHVWCFPRNDILIECIHSGQYHREAHLCGRS